MPMLTTSVGNNLTVNLLGSKYRGCHCGDWTAWWRSPILKSTTGIGTVGPGDSGHQPSGSPWLPGLATEQDRFKLNRHRA
jgi:hypothetical protein